MRQRRVIEPAAGALGVKPPDVVHDPLARAPRGIGPRRRKALLVSFGSLAGVRRASREELTAAVGAKTADAVLGYFAGKAP